MWKGGVYTTCWLAMPARAQFAAIRAWALIGVFGLFACLGLSMPAKAQVHACEWHLLQEHGGPTLPGGSVEWPVGATIYVRLFPFKVTSISSSNPDVVEIFSLSTVGGDAITHRSGIATITAETSDPACATATLNITVKVTEPPTVGDTTTTVDANSSNNLVNLDIDGYEVQFVEVVSGPSNGSATISASGTGIIYTPDAGFSGLDKITYTATNAAGTSAPATATINVQAATYTVSWSSSGRGEIGSVTFNDDPETAISSPVEVSEGRIISFWDPIPDAGATYRQPSGCGIHPVGSAWYTDPVTADCAVSFIFEEITLSPDALPNASEDTSYDETITAIGGLWDFAFAIVSGALPSGLELHENGTLAGAPTETGDFSFTVEARNERGHSRTKSYTLTVEAAPEIAVGPASLPGGTAGTPYEEVTFTAEGGKAPYSFAMTAGALPEGLSLDASGELYGTPTEAGSFTFTVTAIDANDFTGEREYTLTVDAPEIVVTVPSLPDGRVNMEYEPVRLSASGGSEPYAFNLASGDLPDGMTLAADGTLSGTPAEGGEFAFAVRATDAYGFEGSARATLKVEAENLPVAQNHTLEVMAGTSGTLDLTRGAAGGPFTSAAIATHPASEAGDAWVERENGAYILHFAAAGTFAGTASLTYTLSNADGASEPATVTITVIARPDPSLDPEVIGLMRAQTQTAKRFANTQITNFNRRLEQLHNEGERRNNSIGVNLSLQQPTDNANANAPNEDTPHDPAVDAIGQVVSSAADSGSASQATPVENLFGDLAFWSGGFVSFGTNDDGAINLDHTLVGVSAGVDYRFTPQLTAGFGVGYGRDVTEAGSNDTESRAEAFSLAAYGSYRPVPGFFLDGLAGYSTMTFDSVRYVTTTGEFATGSRGGDQLFASLSAGYEFRNEGLLISPYGRLSGSHSTLDAFTETGAGMWNLIYGQQTIDTLSGTLGLRFQYAIPMEWGVLTPRGRLEYTHDFEGASRASLGYADLGTLPYTLNVDGFSRDHLTIDLGLDAQLGESWNLGFDYRTAFGTDGDSQDHTFGVNLGVQF